MSVTPASAARTRDVNGITYHFCSAHGANTFDADPGRYAGPTTGTR